MGWPSQGAVWSQPNLVVAFKVSVQDVSMAAALHLTSAAHLPSDNCY